MIPEEKRDAVTRALGEAFGVSEFEDIQMLTAGLSPAHVFRIVVRGCPYLLRVVMDTGASAGPGGCAGDDVPCPRSPVRRPARPGRRARADDARYTAR